jgi:hypothetical protein
MKMPTPLLMKWCAKLNAKCERAVVFLDPFGAAVEWNVIATLTKTGAVDIVSIFRCKQNAHAGSQAARSGAPAPTGNRRASSD